METNEIIKEPSKDELKFSSKEIERIYKDGLNLDKIFSSDEDEDDY